MFLIQLSLCTSFQPLAHTAPRRNVQSSQIRMVSVGDQVVANNDWRSSSPELGIIRAQVYELQRVYYQGLDDDGSSVKRVDVQTLEAAPPAGCERFSKYVVLFSRRYHSDSGPVTVTPEEVEIVTVKAEIADSAWLALPGLFWVWLVWTIYQYGETHGWVSQRF